MSVVLQVSQSWPGFETIKDLVIFGDSYSSVGQGAAPTPLLPLGVPYPGTQQGLWNEPTLPNWVGHLLVKHRVGPRYNPDVAHQDAAWLDNPLLVHNYATGGAEVCDVDEQISSFLQDRSHLAQRETLFVVWVGINDCAGDQPQAEIVKALFRSVDKLYNGGARNFLFIDVPPINRSPACPSDSEREASLLYLKWNSSLNLYSQEFAFGHSEATIMICSSFAVFSAVLDCPEDYGFLATDARLSYSSVWYDMLHPTSAMHDQMAVHIADFLAGVSVS